MWPPLTGAQRLKYDVFAKVLRRTRSVSNTAARRNSGSLSLSSLNGDNDKSAVPDTGSPPPGPAVDEPRAGVPNSSSVRVSLNWVNCFVMRTRRCASGASSAAPAGLRPLPARADAAASRLLASRAEAGTGRPGDDIGDTRNFGGEICWLCFSGSRAASAAAAAAARGTCSRC